MQNNGVEIIVVNNDTTSPEEEPVPDLISIIHVMFSWRVYDLRKYQKKIVEDEDVAQSLQNRNSASPEPNE